MTIIYLWLAFCIAITLWIAFVNCEVIYHRNKMKKRYGQRNYEWLKKYMEEK